MFTFLPIQGPDSSPSSLSSNAERNKELLSDSKTERRGGGRWLHDLNYRTERKGVGRIYRRGTAKKRAGGKERGKRLVSVTKAVGQKATESTSW